MTFQDGLRCAMGQEIEGAKIVLEVSNEIQHFTAYLTTSHELVFGFDSTRGQIFPPSFDWFQNLFAWPKDFCVGTTSYKAMAGWVQEYRNLRNHLFQCIKVYRPSVVHVYGFSQGSAHATLATRDIGFNFPEIGIICTAFASPRVYTARSAREFDAFLASNLGRIGFLRVNLEGDPVPSLPPAILGYRHVGHKINFAPKKPAPDVVHSGHYYLEVLDGI